MSAPSRPRRTPELAPAVHDCLDQAGPPLSPEDRDLIVQYLVLRALARLQAAPRAPRPTFRRVRCRPRPRSRHGR